MGTIHLSAMRRLIVRRAAFTLVELLAVVAIIGLLVALLVPAISTIRTSAKRTATDATIKELSTGLEHFKSDARLGGAYPPSDSDTNNNDGRVANPYRPPRFGITDARIRVNGAGFLVWALAGADLQGTPGFKKVRPSSTLWSDDTDAPLTATPDSAGLYTLYRDGDPSGRGGQPYYPRSGPYVDIEKTPITSYNDRLRSFTIKTEQDARRGQPPIDRHFPMFLDGFGFPILYWRADPAGQQMADQEARALSSGQQVQRGIYHWRDNGELVDGNDALTLRAGADLHRLDWSSGGVVMSASITNPPLPGFFEGYIRNNDVKAKLAPYKADSFLLISPGEDGVFGSGDDIANFPHNGR